jgi:hypothetical protein
MPARTITLSALVAVKLRNVRAICVLPMTTAATPTKINDARTSVTTPVANSSAITGTTPLPDHAKANDMADATPAVNSGKVVELKPGEVITKMPIMTAADVIADRAAVEAGLEPAHADIPLGNPTAPIDPPEHLTPLAYEHGEKATVVPASVVSEDVDTS